VIIALLSRSMARNHAYLSENITPENIGINWLQIPESMMQNGEAVLMALDGEITRQAATIAYINDFKIMMWLVICIAPMVLLLRKRSD
jgi:DHA2 family multidrug resistance protein